MLVSGLGFISQIEGHTSVGEVKVALCLKLCVFALVQTFFVQAVSGTLFVELEALLDSPFRVRVWVDGLMGGWVEGWVCQGGRVSLCMCV